jgi:multidrug efflux pump subunit AcrA (membrane-fusion protein)
MKKGVMFKTMRVVFVLGIAMAISILLVRFSPKAERQIPVETGRLVEVMPVKAETVTMTVESYGTVQPREVLKLVAEVRGQIVDIHPSFKEGGFIHKGSVLIEIDPRNYQLEVERRRVQVNQSQAELRRLQQEVLNLAASIKIAKSDVALTQKEVLRLKTLSGKNVVAQTTLDQAEQRFLISLERLQGFENQLALTGPLKEQFEAQRDMARVMLRQARLDLERASIVAPFDAWVLERSTEKGQLANSGQLLGSIYRDAAFDLEVRIPVRDLKWLPADINRGGGLLADVILTNDEKRYVWQGRVVRIKAHMEEKTRTLPVVVEVEEALPTGSDLSFFPLRPGMFVMVKIKGKQISRAFTLPRHVIYPGNVVYTFRDNRLNIKPVHILRSFKDSVIVDKGLTDGELIIKTPLSSATDDMLVRLKE